MSPVPEAEGSALAQMYRRFSDVDAAKTSPLLRAAALALSQSVEAMRVIAGVPPRKRQPALILATLHDLTLAGRAPALAAAWAAADSKAVAVAAVDTLVRMPDAVRAIAVRRSVRSDETGHCAVLYPAVAEAARRVGADAVGLIDVGRSTGLNLSVDRVALTYSNGQLLGDMDSVVQMAATVVGYRALPSHRMPEVIGRIGIDRNPLDVKEPEDARWLRACVPPDQPARMARLQAELTLAAEVAPLLLRGDPVQLVPDAIARVRADALPVVLTTWALSKLSPQQRLRFMDHLTEAASDRPVAWVSVEGVGVAPTVPTLGDRPASGHSIIGLSVLEGSEVRTDVLGRCWSRGRLLSWLAEA